MNYKSVAAVGAACVAAAISANAAAFVVGDTLGYASFATITAPSVAPLGAGLVIAAPGGFAGIANPIGLNLALVDSVVPVGPVWNDGAGFSFTATTAVTLSGPDATTGAWSLIASGTVTSPTGSAPADFTMALTRPLGTGGYSFFGASTVVVPEPSTYALLAGLGLVGFAGYRRFRS
jgi:hypothetical protein